MFDEGVLLSIGKYLQGHLRRDEFRVGSYRKIQRHLSLSSSITMASGGGPRSRQPISFSCALILRLSTHSCSNCFKCNYLANYYFIWWDQLLDLNVLTLKLILNLFQGTVCSPLYGQ